MYVIEALKYVCRSPQRMQIVVNPQQIIEKYLKKFSSTLKKRNMTHASLIRWLRSADVADRSRLILIGQ